MKVDRQEFDRAKSDLPKVAPQAFLWRGLNFFHMQLHAIQLHTIQLHTTALNPSSQPHLYELFTSTFD